MSVNDKTEHAPYNYYVLGRTDFNLMVTLNGPNKKMVLILEISYQVGLFSDRTKHYFYN